MLCLVLALMVPCGALAVTTDFTPVTRSDFELRFAVHPEGFPEGTSAHLTDWEKFASALSFKGTIDTQSFLQEFSRVYMNAGLYVNNRSAVPFEYDGYYSFRYLRSPALDNASVHFQMMNFFQFMLKGYNYMELPTDLIALFLYPEAAQALGKAYYTPIEAFFADGAESYDTEALLALCQELNTIAQEDVHYTVSDFLFCLLARYSDPYLAQDKLSSLESVIQAMDPEQEGLTVVREGETVLYKLGEETAFTRTENEEGTQWELSLFDEEEYSLNAHFSNLAGEISLSAAIGCAGEERLSAALTLTGLNSSTQAAGEVTLTIGGAAILERDETLPKPLRFSYAYERTGEELPYTVSLNGSWLHPETGKPALSLMYTADMTDTGETTIPDHPIDNQDDFFHLNESYLAEYKERFTPTLIAAFIPVVLQMPAGALEDVYSLLEETGLISFIMD